MNLAHLTTLPIEHNDLTLLFPIPCKYCSSNIYQFSGFLYGCKRDQNCRIRLRELQFDEKESVCKLPKSQMVLQNIFAHTYSLTAFISRMKILFCHFCCFHDLIFPCYTTFLSVYKPYTRCKVHNEFTITFFSHFNIPSQTIMASIYHPI